MIEIKYNIRTFVNKNQQVLIRVRWNNKKDEVTFSAGCSAEPEKWDNVNQLAKRNTTHKVGGKTCIAREINGRISEICEYITERFKQSELANNIPNKDELKVFVNEKLGRIIEQVSEDELKKKDKTLEDIFKEFLKIRPTENNWSERTHYKYNQMWTHLQSYNSKVELSIIDKAFLNGLKTWYVDKGYHNATIAKHFKNLRGFLNWANGNGYPVNSGALSYKLAITNTKKTVTFLKLTELMLFMDFKFPESKPHLSKVRDFFCFMAFTSLRYSDLRALKHANVSDGKIEFYTQKTKDRLTVPLIEHAKKILDKYKNESEVYAFPVYSNQKINDYLKEAAELAGLDREIVETYFVGAKRFDKEYKLHETISCHDARRTFVCCSLALGIPTTTVMACTGHSNYESMKPYIEVADETQKLQMERWNDYQYKSQIIDILDKADNDKLKEILRLIKTVA